MVVLLALAVSLILSGCGGGGTVDDQPGDTARYVPLAVGNSWQYNYTDYAAKAAVRRPQARPQHPQRGAKATTAVDNVSLTETVSLDGALWYGLVYHYVGEDPLPTVYVRHSAVGFMQRNGQTATPFCQIKLPLEVGTAWTTSWVKQGIVYTSHLKIASVTAEIATPAGTFRNCIQVEDVLQTSTGPDVVTYWYAPDVGEVREEQHVGSNATLSYLLELKEYAIPVAQ